MSERAAKPKFTEGDWAIEDGQIVADGMALGQVFGADDFPCLDDADRDTVTEECHANARLIIAAPKLYAACRAMLAAWRNRNELDDRMAALAMARDAVALADGEPTEPTR